MNIEQPRTCRSTAPSPPFQSFVSPPVPPLSSHPSPISPPPRPRNDFEHELVHHLRSPRKIMLVTNWANAREVYERRTERRREREERRGRKGIKIICWKSHYRIGVHAREFQFYTQAHFNARRALPAAPIGAQLKIIDDDNEPMLRVCGEGQPHGKLTRNFPRGELVANLTRRESSGESSFSRRLYASACGYAWIIFRFAKNFSRDLKTSLHNAFEYLVIIYSKVLEAGVADSPIYRDISACRYVAVSIARAWKDQPRENGSKWRRRKKRKR